MKTFIALLASATLGLAVPGYAAAAAPPLLLSQGFDNVAALGGWHFINHSTPVGNSWFQGNAGIFQAHAGAQDAYIGANFLSAGTGMGTVDNWLLTPELMLAGPTVLSFYTRSAGTPGFNDKLELRFSSGGGTDTTTFTQTLATIGGMGDYPGTWQHYTATIDTTGAGRFAFRYSGDAMMTDYIGLDTLSIAAVPEPSAWAMLAGGLALLAGLRRRAARAGRSALMAGLGLGLASPGLLPSAQAAGQQGMVVVRDAETGQLRAPTAAEFLALGAGDARGRLGPKRPGPVVPVLTQMADGTLRVHAGGRPMYSVVQRGADGRLHASCVDGEHAAQAAPHAPAAAKTGKEHSHELR